MAHPFAYKSLFSTSDLLLACIHYCAIARKRPTAARPPGRHTRLDLAKHAVVPLREAAVPHYRPASFEPGRIATADDGPRSGTLIHVDASTAQASSAGRYDERQGA